jgi:HPt (histidine-containing phosphotransfer) domain-containing protein
MTSAANDDLKAAAEALDRRSEELRAIATSPLSTPDQIRQATRELETINEAYHALNQSQQSEIAALTRQIRELGGRTIRRVVKNPDGSTTIF